MDFICEVEEAAEFLDITTRRIYQLVKAEVFDRLPDGKFDLREISEKYYEFKFGNGSRDLNQVKAEHEEIKKRISGLKLAKMRGKLHESNDVEIIMTNMLVTFRNRILSMPSKLAPILSGKTDTQKINKILDKELRDILTELSEYDPMLFAEEDDYINIEGDDIAEENNKPIRENNKSSSTTTRSNS